MTSSVPAPEEHASPQCHQLLSLLSGLADLRTARQETQPVALLKAVLT